MKKFILITVLLGCIVFSSCKEEKPVLISGNVWGEGAIASTDGKNYNKDIVSSIDVAVNIAKAVFESMDIEKDYQKFIVSGVMFDECDGVWIVIFSKDINALDGSWNIAIRKSDGAVQKIWYS